MWRSESAAATVTIRLHVVGENGVSCDPLASSAIRTGLTLWMPATSFVWSRPLTNSSDCVRSRDLDTLPRRGHFACLRHEVTFADIAVRPL